MSPAAPSPAGHERWFPVARSEEVVARHITEALLLGQDLAVWRDDAGAVNAWENRCPHRGVRLSIGYNTGMELRCQYHGWRFASGSGHCRFIPAHPTQKPAATMGARTFGICEAGGYAWVRLAGADGSAPPPAGVTTTLRSVFMHAPVAAVAAALQAGYAADGAGPVPALAQDPYTLSVQSATDSLLFRLQPVDADRCIVHAALAGPSAGIDRYRWHNAQLTALRRRLGSAA
jgi:nitrite reductase/ring-hydroxylating ferredoxin subunit